jgi:hypothetical protein
VNGTVFRAPKRNRNGDPVDQDGDPVRLSGDGVAKVGVITGLIIGSANVGGVATRGDVASTEGLVGAPTTAAIRLQHGDIVQTEDGVRYKLSGPQLWGRPHSLTGSTETARYAWWQATSTVN